MSMVWGQVLWLLLAAETLWSVWGQSVPKSPCPNVFWYEVDSSGIWRGRISIPAPPPGVTFRTIVELDIDAVLPTQNVGAVKLLENENEVWRRISSGTRWPVQFQVYFPLSWPLPQLRSITSNGNVICISNISHTLLTKVTLEHVLYPVGGATYQRQNKNVNQPVNGVNYYPNVARNTKNDPYYEANPREQDGIDTSIPAAYQEESAPKPRMLPLGTNITAVPSQAVCPAVFEYQQSSSGVWFGKISVPNPYPILAVDIKVEMYVTGNVPMISSGSLQPANNLNEEWNRIKAGDKFSIQYTLQFPMYKTYASYTPPLPTVKSIMVNEKLLCSGDTPRYSLLITVIYEHSIFSDRCPSSSLTCPYNMEYTARQNQPAPPGYTPPQTFDMTSQIYRPTLQINTSPPTLETTSQYYKPSPPPHAPTSEIYEPSSTSNEPTSQVYGTSPATSAPTSATYGPSSPKSEIYTPSPPTYKPTSHTYTTQSTTTHKPTSKIYTPSPPTYKPTSHTYTPSPPTYRPTSHTYTPSPPTYQPTYPTYRTPPEEYLLPPRFADEFALQTTEQIQCGTLVIRNTLIAHGEDTMPGQWPWHAALYLYSKRDMKYRCGGSFVGIRTVITAAHCVIVKGELLRAEDFIVYLGRHNLRDMNEFGIQYKNVAKVAVHPSYNGTYNVGDIALLILASVVEVTTVVRPVCLWGIDDGSPIDIINQVGLVVGWGLDETDEPTETLMMVKMPVVSQQNCIWSDPPYYSQFTSNGTFCAGFRNGSSVCNGDSGGGMVFPRNLTDGTPVWVLRGIVSNSRARYGYSICDTRNYIVFTDIAQYLDWIYQIMI